MIIEKIVIISCAILVLTSVTLVMLDELDKALIAAYLFVLLIGISVIAATLTL